MQLQRMISGLKVQIPMFLFLILIVVIGFYTLPGYSLDAYNAYLYGFPLNAGMVNGVYTTYFCKFTFMQSTYIVYCFLGMLCFVIFGSVGLVVLPFDILLEFIYRPKPISQSEFKKRTKVLLPRIIETRKAGKKIEDERFLVENIRGFTGYVKRMQFSSAMRRWETEILFCETEFVKL
jgi:hypothetical protein